MNRNRKKPATTGRAPKTPSQPAKTTWTAPGAKKNSTDHSVPVTSSTVQNPPPPPPEEKKADPEAIKRNQAATVIQCAWRRRGAKRQLERAKKEKAEFEERMKELESQAFLAQIKLEQELEEKKRLKKS